MDRARRLALPGVAVGMALLVLGPVLGRGFVLAYDMVFAPRQWLLPDSVGLGSALPRSVPADAVVALMTTVVPGDLVQQALLAAALVAGPLGAGLLVPTGSLGVRLVAAVAYGWSGYVAERLFIGHWPYLLAYACLPWVVRAAMRLRGVGLRPPVTSLPSGTDSSGDAQVREVGADGAGSAAGESADAPTGHPGLAAGQARRCGLAAEEARHPGLTAGQGGPTADGHPKLAVGQVGRGAPAGHGAPAGRGGLWRDVARLVVALAPAVLTPSGGIIAALVGVVAGGWRGLRVTVPVAVVLNAPWWVPAVLHPGGGLSTSDGAGAFGARADGWGGVVVSLLGLGGIWNSEVTPDSRGNPLVPLLVLAVVAVAVVGWWEWRRSPAAGGLIALGVVGVVAGALGGTGLYGWLAANVPGGGLLRDSQKWVAWWGLPLAIGFALGVGAAAKMLVRGRRVLLVGAMVLPVAMMPDLAWGGWGRLESVEYPRDWNEVAGILADDPRAGDVVTLPFSAFRQFGWNGHRTQLDPAPRVLPRTTVIDDTLFVGGQPVAGEDSRAAAVREVVALRGGLGGLGIGWVLVERGTPGPASDDLTDDMERVYQGEWLELYRVPGAIAAPDHPTAPREAVLAADVIALATVTLGLLWLVLPAGRLIPSRPRRRE